MQKLKNNYAFIAFIDAQNLYLGIARLGWKLDYRKFKTCLEEKYGIEKAYIFMGFVPTNQQLYTFLQNSGFVLIFKPILETEDKKIKGNCDAELVLQVMIDLRSYDKALIVTGDGDFYCLIKYLGDNGKFLKVLAPSPNNCSALINKSAGNKISFVSDLRRKLEYKGTASKPHILSFCKIFYPALEKKLNNISDIALLFFLCLTTKILQNHQKEGLEAVP